MIRANDVRGNQGGIAVERVAGQPRSSSTTPAARLGTGIEVGVLSPGNDVLQNIASENGGEGIAVEDSAPIQGRGVQLDGQQADGNGGDGIALEGVGHVVEDNSARLNGGWGIYAAVGAVDRGGNIAGRQRRARPVLRRRLHDQAPVPGAPETWIVSFQGHGQPLPTSTDSRNASFTYIGNDRETPAPRDRLRVPPRQHERLDGLGGLRLPGGVPEPGARARTRSRSARIDMHGAGLADPTPAQLHLDLPAAAAQRRARGRSSTSSRRTRPGCSTPMFTFHSNEPDVTFECKVDLDPATSRAASSRPRTCRGRVRVGLRGDRGRRAHLLRPRDRLRGQRRPARHLHVERARRRRPAFTDGPGLHAARDAARSGHRRRDARAPRRRSTSRPTWRTRRSSARSTSSRSSRARRRSPTPAWRSASTSSA